MSVVVLAASFVIRPVDAGQAGRERPREAVASPIAKDDNARRLWADDATFAQLSSASQARLERAFGPKRRRGVDPKAGDGPFPRNVAETVAFDNILVNDPEPEPPGYDMQNE